MIQLLEVKAEDAYELMMLKNQFNRYATQMNLLWNSLTFEEKTELYNKLKATEQEIMQYE